MAWKPYLKKFAAYYYNRAEKWGEEVTINYKFDAFMLRSAVFDIERGQLDSIHPRDEAGLHIKGKKGYKTEYPVCFKIKTE